jgi:hypothetical protein
MSSPASRVSLTGEPSGICWTQMSRFPSPLRSDANASNFPSREMAGWSVQPTSDVSRTSDGRGATVSGVRNHRHSPTAATASTAMRTALASSPNHDGRRQRPIVVDTPAAASAPDSYSSRSSSSATLRSAIDCHRRSGFFRRQRTMTFSRSRGNSGTIRLGGSGSFVRIAASVDIFESPRNARRPVTIS